MLKLGSFREEVSAFGRSYEQQHDSDGKMHSIQDSADMLQRKKDKKRK
jgi:hypothetical protein